MAGRMKQMNGNGVIRMAAIAVTVVVLSGCVETVWVKPGATPQERVRQETACEAQALKALPPDNVVAHRHASGRVKAGKTPASHGHRDGERTVTADRDTDWRTEDANADSREVLIRDCMYRAGWNEQEEK